MFNLFDCIVTGDNENVKNGKPAPDIFLEAARQLKVENPEDCLVFEGKKKKKKSKLKKKRIFRSINNNIITKIMMM